MLNPLLYQFRNSLERYGYNVTVNNSDQVRVLFKEYNELNNTSEYKFMLFENGQIKQGDIINVFDDNWLVQHEDISINDVYTKIVIRRLKFDIKFNFEGEIIAIPSAINEGTYRLDEGKLITLPEGRIVLHMQENEISNRIAKDQRFLIMGNAWKVIQKTSTEHGLCKIYADIDVFGTDDDKENEIADRWKYETKNNYTITINNVIESPLPLGDSLQLDVTVTNNGEVVTVPLTYTSSNIGVLTVDNGLVNCVGVGSANITVAVTSNPDAKDIITISVEEVAEDNFTIEIEGQDTINMITNGTYTATVFNNNVEVDKEVIFSIDNTSLATIKSQDGTSCVVVANPDWKLGDFKLKAVMVEDANIFGLKTITVTGL